MKKLLLTAVFVTFLLPLLYAQQSSGTILRGTTWKGIFSVPDPIDCLMQFKKDTALLIYAGTAPISIMGDGRIVTGKDSAALEVMTYTQHGDTVTFSKVSGGSPCGKEPGVYLAQKSNEKMGLVLISDGCEERKSAMAKEIVQVQ